MGRYLGDGLSGGGWVVRLGMGCQMEGMDCQVGALPGLFHLLL